MLWLKKEAYNRIQDIITIKKGTPSVGSSPERGSAMFAHVYLAFHNQYPDITINAVAVSVKNIKQLWQGSVTK